MENDVGTYKAALVVRRVVNHVVVDVQVALDEPRFVYSVLDLVPDVLRPSAYMADGGDRLDFVGKERGAFAIYLQFEEGVRGIEAEARVSHRGNGDCVVCCFLRGAALLLLW